MITKANRLLCPLKTIFQTKKTTLCVCIRFMNKLMKFMKNNSLSIFVVSVSFSLTLHTDI